MNIKHFGTLYIVATPIGNLGDMSARAIEVLKAVDCIAAEDTRHSALLLQHFLVKTPAVSLYEHNERERSLELIEQLKTGKSIALISDAGTPLISDPGYIFVNKVRELGVKIVPIPGPCALIAALSVAGLPTDRFSFEGFLPAKSKHRLDQLELLKHETRTMIFYEAPHRVLDSLQDMQTVFGPEREAVIARELTKIYETIQKANISELIAWIQKDNYQERGEIVLIVRGAEAILNSVEEGLNVDILKILLEELPLKQAVDLAAKISGQRKNDLYKQALEIKNLRK